MVTAMDGRAATVKRVEQLERRERRRDQVLAPVDRPVLRRVSRAQTTSGSGWRRSARASQVLGDVGEAVTLARR